MNNRNNLDVVHSATITTSGAQVRWAVKDIATGQLLGEGTGSTEGEAQQNFKNSLLHNGWDPDDIAKLTQGEEGWLI